jgi:hypothetical protein
MLARKLFSITPSTANTRENPRTKYTVLRNMLSLVDLLTVTEVLIFWPETSLRVVPDKYETNAGIIGRMQGEKNDPAPASADIVMLASTTSIKQLQIFAYLLFSRSVPDYTKNYGVALVVFVPSGHTVTFKRAINPASSAKCMTTK